MAAGGAARTDRDRSPVAAAKTSRALGVFRRGHPPHVLRPGDRSRSVGVPLGRAGLSAGVTPYLGSFVSSAWGLQCARTIPRPRCVIEGEPHVRKRFRPFGAAQRAFPTGSPQRLPGFPRDSQAAVISPPSFPPPPLPFPSFPLVSEKSNGTISPSPARAILPPMRDSFAPPPSRSPRPLAGSPAQAPTEPARAAPTPANPLRLLDANQAKPRKTKENQTRGPLWRRWPSDLPCPPPPESGALSSAPRSATRGQLLHQ